MSNSNIKVKENNKEDFNSDTMHPELKKLLEKRRNKHNRPDVLRINIKPEDSNLLSKELKDKFSKRMNKQNTKE